MGEEHPFVTHVLKQSSLKERHFHCLFSEKPLFAQNSKISLKFLTARDLVQGC